jgi:hypothetical protein
MTTAAGGSTFADKGGSTGLKESLLDELKLTIVDATYFVGNMAESMKPLNPTHLYNQDTLAKSSVSTYTLIEGQAISLSAPAELTQATNWVEELGVAYSISNIMAETQYGGADDRVAYETTKALKKLGMAIESSLVLSTGYSGTSAAGRKMKGLATHCTATTGVTGAGSSGAAFASSASGQSKIDEVLVLMNNSGAPANVMVVSPTNSIYMAQWNDYGTRTSMTDATTRGTKIVVYRTNFGDLKLIISTYQPDTMIGLIDETEYFLNWMIKPHKLDMGQMNYAKDFAVEAAATNEARVAAAFGNVTLS